MGHKPPSPSEKALRNASSHPPPQLNSDHFTDSNEFSNSNDKLSHLVKQILLGKNMELAHMLNGGATGNPLLNGGDDIDTMHPLFGNTGDGHGTCKWPGCEMAFEDFQSFLR